MTSLQTKNWTLLFSWFYLFFSFFFWPAHTFQWTILAQNVWTPMLYTKPVCVFYCESPVWISCFVCLALLRSVNPVRRKQHNQCISAPIALIISLYLKAQDLVSKFSFYCIITHHHHHIKQSFSFLFLFLFLASADLNRRMWLTGDKRGKNASERCYF